MNASKENARKQLATAGILAELAQRHGDGMFQQAVGNLIKFIEAAEKRLPSEAAIERDRKRPRLGGRAKK
jgi:hypothetical protein